MSQQKSIIVELQRLASDSNQNILELLRKALIVATKLEIHDLKEWVQCELNGYKDKEIPSYRNVTATVMLRNPYQGWIPISFPQREIEETLTNRPIHEPIGSLLRLFDDADKDNTLYLQMPSEVQLGVSRLLDPQFHQFPIYWVISRNQILSIFEAVKNTILDWSLRLEQAGILGTELTFSEDEKQKATSNTTIRNVENFNFQGILGTVENSIINQNMKITINEGDLASLRDRLNELKVNQDDIGELEVAIKKDPKPTKAGHFGEQVGGWIGKMVGKAASSLWDNAVATAGQVLAMAISSYYGFQ